MTIEPEPHVPSYINDIRAQPAALDELLKQPVPAEPTELLQRLESFDRIVLTGMGSSLQGMYPSFLRLAAAGLPIWFEDSAELLGYQDGLLTARSLLWVTSQSGESAEAIALLDRVARPGGPTVLAVTNDLTSTLATSAATVLPLHSGDERTVGTRSYINTLAVFANATSVALHETPDPELIEAPAKLAAYLEKWEQRIEEIDDAIPGTPTFVLGRGASLGSARTGALILKEAARHPVEGMSVPQFRHGPLEMADHSITVVLLAGADDDRNRNEQMRRDLEATGARCVWIDAQPDVDPSLTMPHLRGKLARPLAEILPLQLLSVVLAQRLGHEPGEFRQIEKITRTL
jgi:glucosamine--fructose-6-phosphate aminotransferase (isomerizing)